MIRNLAFAMLALVSITITSCGSGEDSETTEEVSTAKNYVVLTVDGGDAINVESDHVAWSNDHLSGVTQNYYQKEKFKLEFTDLSERIGQNPKDIHGQDFPVIITYEDHEYNTTATINESEGGETNDYLGKEYILNGTISGFQMGDKKVTRGEFAFNTYVKK